MLSVNDCIQKYSVKDKATSILKIQSVCKDIDMFLRVCTQQKGHIVLHTIIKITSIHLAVRLLKNYLGLFQSEMVFVYILKTK